MIRHLLGCSLLFTGCVATDVGNPQTDVQTEATVEVRAFEEETPVNALVLSDGVELTHVWLATDRIELRPCDAAEDEANNGTGEVDSEDGDILRATDLLSATSLPNMITVGGVGRDFCGLRVGIRRVEADAIPPGAPAELADHSILVRGIRKDGNAFVVSAVLETTLELDGAIQLSADSPNNLVLGFAVNGWITQGDLAGLTGDPILIDEENNSELYEGFEDTATTSARLFRNVLGGTPIAQ